MKLFHMKKWLCMMMVACLLMNTALPVSWAEELPATAQDDSIAVQLSTDVAAEEEQAALAGEPTATPAEEPTEAPAVTPTEEPAATPTEEPTEAPAVTPTEEPAAAPTEEPAAAPTEEPTATPTTEPTATPTAEPTATPTTEPTATPTEAPTATPTAEPTATPTEAPTATPTEEPKQTIVGFEPAKYTMTAEYGAAQDQVGLPGTVTANLSDGTSVDVTVVWSCADYDPQHGQAEPVSYTFTAALAEDTYACQAALPTAMVEVAAAPAVPMLFAGNGGASTLADYGDPFTLEIQRIGGNYSFYPGETIVVKLTDFALQEGHTLKSVTVWTDAEGLSEKQTLQNPQEGDTVAFVVPEDAAEESFLRVYATAEIVDVSGDAVEGYPEQVKFPYFFSISHQIEVAIDVTVVPIGILPDKAKIVINKVYYVDPSISGNMYDSDVTYTYQWNGEGNPGSRLNETITHDSTEPCTYTLHIDDERSYKLVGDYTYTLQNVEKSEAPLSLSVSPDGSETLEPLTIAALPTNTLKSGHTIKEVQAICTYRNDGTEHPVTLTGNAQNGFSAEFTPTANGIWDISISYTVQDAEGADVSAYYYAPSSTSVTMGPKVIDISLDFYKSEQVGKYGDQKTFFVTYQCNQVESLEGLITIRETAGKPGVVTYDGNKVTFTATGVGTYSLISELVEGAEKKGYIHTTTQTMLLTIQPGSAQATLALDKDSYLSGETVTVTVTPGTPVGDDYVTGFTLSMSNGETTVSSEKYDDIPDTVSLTLPDDAQGTWTVSAEVTLANAQGQDVTGFYNAVSTVSLLAGDPLVTISLDNGSAFAPSDWVHFWLNAKNDQMEAVGGTVRVYLTMTSPSGDQTVSDDFKIDAGGTGLGHLRLPDDAEEGMWKVTGSFTCDNASLNGIVNSLTFAVGKIKINLAAQEADVSGAPGKTVITYTSEEALPSGVLDLLDLQVTKNGESAPAAAYTATADGRNICVTLQQTGEYTVTPKVAASESARCALTVTPETVQAQVTAELTLNGVAQNITYGQAEHGTLTVTLDTGDDITIAEVMTFDVTRDGEPFTVSDDNHASLTYDGKIATFTARDAGTYALTPRLTEVYAGSQPVVNGSMTMTVAKAAFPLTLTPQGANYIGKYMAVAIADNGTIAEWDKDVILDFRFDDADSQHAHYVGYNYNFLLSITDNLQNTDGLFELPATRQGGVENKLGKWTLNMKFSSISVARNYETVEPISFMVYDEIELTASATNATYGQGDGVLKVTAPAGVNLENDVTFDVTRDGDPFEVSDANHASLTIEGNTAIFTARDAGAYALTARATGDDGSVLFRIGGDTSVTVAKAAFPISLTLPEGPYAISDTLAATAVLNGIAEGDGDMAIDMTLTDGQGAMVRTSSRTYDDLKGNSQLAFELAATRTDGHPSVPGEWILRLSLDDSSAIARNYEEAAPVTLHVYNELLELTASATNAIYGQDYGVLTMTAPEGFVLEGNVTFDVTRNGVPFTVNEENHATLTYQGNTATFTARDAGTYVLTPRMTDSDTVGVKPSSDLTVTVEKAPFPISLTMPEGQPYVIGSIIEAEVTLNGIADWDKEEYITLFWDDAEGEAVYDQYSSYDYLEEYGRFNIALSDTRMDNGPSVPGEWTIMLSIGYAGVGENYESAEPITFRVCKAVELTAVAQSTGDVLQYGDYLKPGETIVFAADVPGGLSAYADVKVLQNGSEPVELPINSDAEGNVYITFPEMNGYAIEFTPKDSDYIYTLSPSAMYVNVIDGEVIAVKISSPPMVMDNHKPGCAIFVSLDAASEITGEDFIRLFEEGKLIPVVTCDGERVESGKFTYLVNKTPDNMVKIQLYGLGTYDITMELDGEAERDYALTVESLEGYPVEPTPPLMEIGTDAGTYAPGSQITVTASRVNVGTSDDSYGYLLASRGDEFEYVDVWAENEAGQKTNEARYDVDASGDPFFLYSQPKLTLTLPNDAQSGRWTVYAQYHVSNNGQYSSDIMEAYSPASPVYVAVATADQQVIELTAGAQDGVYGEGGASVTFTAGETVNLVDLVKLSVLRDGEAFDSAGLVSYAVSSITFAPVLAGTYTVTPVLTAGSEAEYVLMAESATVTVNRAAAPLAVAVDQAQYGPGDTVQVTLTPQALAGDDELVINEVWACSVDNEYETARVTYTDGLVLAQEQKLTLTLPGDAYGEWQVQVNYAVRHGGEDRTGCYESAQMPAFDVQGTIPVQMEAYVEDGEYGSAGVYFHLQYQAGLSITDFSLNITRNGESYQFENEAMELQYNEGSGYCFFNPMNVGTFEVEIVGNDPRYVVQLEPQTLTVTPATLLTIEPDSSTVEPGKAIAGKIALDAVWLEMFQEDWFATLDSITVWAEKDGETTEKVVCFDGTSEIPSTLPFSIPLDENATPGTWTVYAQAQVEHIQSGKDASDCYAVATASVRVEGVEPEYTLIIPASVTLDGDGAGSLQLSCTRMENAASVQVTVDSENNFTLKDGENAIAYTLSDESGAIQNGDVAARFTATGNVDLSLAVTQGQSPVPGTYTDTLTFTASAE